MSQNNFGLGSGSSTPASPWYSSANSTSTSSQSWAQPAQSPPHQAAPAGTGNQAQGNPTFNVTFDSTSPASFHTPTHSPRPYAQGNSQSNSQTFGSETGSVMSYGNFGSPSTTSAPGSPPYTPPSQRSSQWDSGSSFGGSNVGGSNFGSDSGSNFGSPQAPRSPRHNAGFSGSDTSGITHADIAQFQSGFGFNMGSINETMAVPSPANQTSKTPPGPTTGSVTPREDLWGAGQNWGTRN